MDNRDDAQNEAAEPGKTSGQQAGAPEEQADGGPEKENPLANLDPDKIAAEAGGAKEKVLFNDPSADPLWNPALEPDPAADPLSGGADPGEEAESGRGNAAGNDR